MKGNHFYVDVAHNPFPKKGNIAFTQIQTLTRAIKLFATSFFQITCNSLEQRRLKRRSKEVFVTDYNLLVHSTNGRLRWKTKPEASRVIYYSAYPSLSRVETAEDLVRRCSLQQH